MKQDMNHINTHEKNALSDHNNDLRIVVKALAAERARPNELARTMLPHPLVYQELPYDPEFCIYNDRLMSTNVNNASPDQMYWSVRRQVMIRHTGELPLEVRGADAEKLLDRVFTRDISKVKVARCSYQFACYDDGGMITDGILMKLADNRFWYVQADGDLFSWFKAHARGLDVEVFDPGVWVSQVQGPLSLEVLTAAVDGGHPEPFRYFDIAEVRIAGQKITLSRTGFTNELGWEFYLGPEADARAVGDRILEAGEPHGMLLVASHASRPRRIEAGILNAGSDFDETVTPFVAGLGEFVDLGKADFIGKSALQQADKRRRTWGMRVQDGIAHIGDVLTKDCTPAGIVCSSAWSPFQQCGVAIVRLTDPNLGPGTTLEVECTDGGRRPAVICETPMYDQKREIPRGKLVNIPEIPDANVT